MCMVGDVFFVAAVVFCFYSRPCVYFAVKQNLFFLFCFVFHSDNLSFMKLRDGTKRSIKVYTVCKCPILGLLAVKGLDTSTYFLSWKF